MTINKHLWFICFISITLIFAFLLFIFKNKTEIKDNLNFYEKLSIFVVGIIYVIIQAKASKAEEDKTDKKGKVINLKVEKKTITRKKRKRKINKNNNILDKAVDFLSTLVKNRDTVRELKKITGEKKREAKYLIDSVLQEIKYIIDN